MKQIDFHLCDDRKVLAKWVQLSYLFTMERMQTMATSFIFGLCVLCCLVGHTNGHSSVKQSHNKSEEPIWKAGYMKLIERFGLDSTETAIIISVKEQRLFVITNAEVSHQYAVSTSKYGIGNEAGSNRTPLGTHRICSKIGAGAPVGMVFRVRRPTGRIARIYTDETDAEEDFVTTRILRLEGLEPGVNRGEGIDSYARFIYIHGTPEEGLIGRPSSHGCIRMKNRDVVELFNIVKEGTLVEIQE